MIAYITGVACATSIVYNIYQAHQIQDLLEKNIVDERLLKETSDALKEYKWIEKLKKEEARRELC